MEGLKRGRIVYFWEYGMEHAAVVTHVHGQFGNGTTINCYVFPDGMGHRHGVLKEMVAYQPMPELGLGQKSPEEHTWHWMFTGQSNRYETLAKESQNTRTQANQKVTPTDCPAASPGESPLRRG